VTAKIVCTYMIYGLDLQEDFSIKLKNLLLIIFNVEALTSNVRKLLRLLLFLSHCFMPSWYKRINRFVRKTQN